MCIFELFLRLMSGVYVWTRIGVLQTRPHTVVCVLYPMWISFWKKFLTFQHVRINSITLQWRVLSPCNWKYCVNVSLDKSFTYWELSQCSWSIMTVYFWRRMFIFLINYFGVDNSFRTLMLFYLNWGFFDCCKLFNLN